MREGFRVGSVCCALLFAAPLGSVSATSNAPEAGAFLHDFYAAYNARDGARMAQFYAVNATFVDPTFELDLKGRDAISELLDKVLSKYDVLEHEIQRAIVSGDDLVVEGVMIGKLGQKRVRVPFVSAFHFNGGKISSQRDMYDTLHYLVQVGAITSPFPAKASAPGSAGSPTS